MASLEDIASDLKIDLITPRQTKAIGHKRRPWLVEDEHENNTQPKEVYTPNQKGFINPVDQPLSSTPLINPIDQPLSDKGFIKGGYKPLSISLENLRGNPLKLAYFLYELIRAEANKITKKITQSDIIQALEISRDSAKTAVRFLLKNKLIERVNFKIGKKGWSQYSMKTSLLEEIEGAVKNSAIPFRFSTPNSASNQKGFNSSSNINNKTTTTDINPFSWESIDVSPLGNIGAAIKKQLNRLKTVSTPQLVQESINHFAYGLKFNAKTQAYPDPIGTLMGTLLKGGHWHEQDYKSPLEISLEEMAKREEEENKRIEDQKNKLKKFDFDRWVESLTEANKNKIISEMGGVSNLLPNQARKSAERGQLSAYHEKNIWPEKIKQILTNI